MTAETFEELLSLARKHKVLAFELGELKVTFSTLAQVPDVEKPNPTEMTKVQDPSRKPMDFGNFKEKEIFGG